MQTEFGVPADPVTTAKHCDSDLGTPHSGSMERVSAARPKSNPRKSVIPPFLLAIGLLSVATSTADQSRARLSAAVGYPIATKTDSK